MSRASSGQRSWSLRTALVLCAGLLAVLAPVAATANATTPHRAGGHHAVVVHVVAQAGSIGHPLDADVIAAAAAVAPDTTPDTSDYSPIDSAVTAHALLARGPPVQAAA